SSIDPLGLTGCDPCPPGRGIDDWDSGGGGGGAWWNLTFSAANSSINLNAYSDYLDQVAFGANYYNRPGYANPQAEAESNYLASVQTAFVTEKARHAADTTFGILDADSNCSSFFNDKAIVFSEGSQTSGADIFGGVDIRLGVAEEPTIGARTQQGMGAQGAIFLNPVGPFFRAFGTTGSRIFPLSVGPYTGSTIRAQVTILLHEFGHLINAIPRDAGSPEQSVLNTRSILKQCGSAIEGVKK
ncbi:MAG TPA: hypothetical protein VEG30_15055, partial [Terriglobales bacterium]|nr:hypothetical protein [Terriglobales bacterium]